MGLKFIFLTISIVLMWKKEFEGFVTGLETDPDYYELLGLWPTATFDEVLRNYRNLLKRYDPDRNPQAAEAFFGGRLLKLVPDKAVIETYLKTTYVPMLTRAYKTLSIHQLKSTYDRKRKDKKINKNLYDDDEFVERVLTEMEKSVDQNWSFVREEVRPKIREELINDTIKSKQLNITEVCREQCEAGTCTEAGVCKCTNPRKHTGKFCEEEIDPVCMAANYDDGDPNLFCKNGGECIRDNFISKCVCMENFAGVHCARRWSCLLDVDGGRRTLDRCKHGRCMEIDPNDRYFSKYTFSKCLCYFGYTGTLCKQRLQYDNDWSCIHGDLITETDLRRFACDCDPGWQGQNCNQPCERNFYGKGCVLGCLGIHFCKHAAPCDPVDGECPRVDGDEDPCDPGWTSITCDYPNQYYVRSYFEQSTTDISHFEVTKMYFDYQKEERVLTRFMLQAFLQYDIRGKFYLTSGKPVPTIKRRSNNDSRIAKGSYIQQRSHNKMRNGRQTAEHTELERMNLEELQTRARDVGLRVHEFKFTRKQPRTIGVKFNVNFPKDEKINLQDVVDDVIRSNAHKYNSTFGDNFKIDMKTITVSQVKEVKLPNMKTTQGRNYFNSTTVGVALLALASTACLVIASWVAMRKHQRRSLGNAKAKQRRMVQRRTLDMRTSQNRGYIRPVLALSRQVKK